MFKKPTQFITMFAVAHLAFIVPFVPLASIFPVGLGVLCMSSMAFSLILAARWRFVDTLTGGPDKSYAAHRWLGFLTLSAALGHWALASSVGAGVLPALAESAEEAGTIVVTALIVMTAAALLRAIPYHFWKASHMLMGPIFVLSAYHMFFVASPLAVGSAPWTLMVIVSVAGLFAWMRTLLRKMTPSRLVTVESVKRFGGGVDITLRSDTALPPFRPGQFATLSYNCARAEAHPFTIAGGDTGSRRFLIRAGGDWTKKFVRHVAPGDQLRAGHSAGRFLPQIRRRRREQLWVAGGVGITPFLAALECMQPDRAAPIKLIYCIRSQETTGALKDVKDHAERLPQLDLTVLNDHKGQKLTKEFFGDIVRSLASGTQVYVCGPDGLKALVKEVWLAAGMKGRIHSERFDFRGAYALSDLVYIARSVLEGAWNWFSERKGLHSATGA